MGVAKEVSNYDVTELLGHVQVELSVVCKIVRVPWWYVGNDHYLQPGRSDTIILR